MTATIQAETAKKVDPNAEYTREEAIKLVGAQIRDWLNEVPYPDADYYPHLKGMTRKQIARQRPREAMTQEDIMARWPRLCAHLICHSNGYAVPRVAANIIRDAATGNENWCEWIFTCYKRDPKPAVQHAIQGRHRHNGYMAEYLQGLVVVGRELITGKGPQLASWF